MGGAGKLSRFCLSRIATHARAPGEARHIAAGPGPGLRSGLRSGNGNSVSVMKDSHDHDHVHPPHEQHQQQHKTETTEAEAAAAAACSSSSRKIMVVVDSTPEAKRALLWALSHTVQDQDVLVLLHVLRLSKPKKPVGSAVSDKDCQQEINQQNIDDRSYQLPNSLKMLSKSRRPEVEVEVVVVEGQEKGPTIVAQAKKQGASLLVLGQRKPSLLWRMLITWAGTRGTETGGGVVEYCIQNADCMTLAVRRKSRKTGGYLITTRRQKNFWLLA